MSRSGVLALGMAAVTLLVGGGLFAQAPRAPLVFTAQTIGTELRGGYQAVVADLNKDGHPDIIAIATGMKEVPWYQNPGTSGGAWTRHVLVSGVSTPINAAVHDLDEDGIPEVALATGFATAYGKSAGNLSLLTHQGDPTGPWTLKEIDQTPTAHRVRWVDVDGRGKVLVNAPLIGAGSVAPDYTDAVGIYYYRAPDWKRQTLTDADRGVIHGLWVTPWNGAPHEALLSASFNGVFAHQFQNGAWARTRVVAGDPSPWPTSGASDVAPGRLGKAGRFLATIEPWHGNKVGVYLPDGASWRRRVIDESITDGHTLVTADLDEDGIDEIVVGERGGKRSVYLYRAVTASGESWTRQVLDEGGMAGAGCAVADFNGDARMDIACIGTATANLKIYLNGN
jgi:hypothetical protein